jgi:ribosomal protein S18 acetylase RimI-like enzyme
MDTPDGIGPLRDGERSEAVWLLARAFRDNPLNVAVIGAGDARRRLRVNRHGMRALLPVAQAHGRVLVLRRNGRPVGALVAAAPGLPRLPPPPLWARLRCLAGQGLRVSQRWSLVFEAVSALHPAGPHAYLGPLGVDPGLQGRGVGSALLSHWLADTDLHGLPAYLETDVPANVGFYARAGFAVAGEVSILGVRVWRMERAAQRGASARPARLPTGLPTAGLRRREEL